MKTKPIINLRDYEQRKAKEEHRHRQEVDAITSALMKFQRECRHNGRAFHQQSASGNEYFVECSLCGKMLS